MVTMDIDRTYIRKVLWRFLRNASDVEDVTQEVLLRAFTKKDTFKEGSLVTSWLFKIAKNAALDFLRKRKRYTRDLTFTLDHSTNPHIQINARLDVAKALTAVTAMGPKCAEVFHRRYVDGETEGKVAKAMGLPLATIKARANRARLVALAAVNA